MSGYVPKLGHLVTLKSGGPVMTIKHVSYATKGSCQLTCVWFTKDEQLVESVFKVETIEVKQ